MLEEERLPPQSKWNGWLIQAQTDPIFATTILEMDSPGEW